MIYQRLVMKIFWGEIEKTVEAYIDDMVVKSKAKAMHEEDLQSVFDILQRDKLKLNASKCLFGLSSRKFLGYIVTQRGIEPNPAPTKFKQYIRYSDPAQGRK